MRANKYSEEEIAIVRAAGLELPGVTGEERRAYVAPLCLVGEC